VCKRFDRNFLVFPHLSDLTCVRLYVRCFPSVNWSAKAKRRRTQGTGRMQYMKSMPRRFKNGFQEGTTATKQK
jgi:hypothetical protein